ncbi:hypothetical protein KMW28_26775 [Flammeovirga yaeyamensis]|uniref:Uncharacterized protein n=1 Tax=Flammeovirga yaeyamensis TaxID=367791 RepID=A0AAX1NAK3_9BACT|nr:MULTISPECIES: hypothetical protein [Flammeovirga]ANQ52267.1 hypothetical protein MY04_4932 [Flammeovirga sp. MY04]MBB3701400.1 hypothetical protein [Flammeovirga yaeyamensis]NMF38642.1 hypothetical protein [Flammeovirga yaeyamensis]QWG04504.1 hypothetical protein KMW28_26775 [Flammeovirga yaeyamensis]
MSIKIKELNIKIEIKRDFISQEKMLEEFVQKLSIDHLPDDFVENLAEKCKEEINNDNKLFSHKFGRF